MRFPAISKQKAPVKDEGAACLNPVMAFSIIGLLLALILTNLPPTEHFASSELVLIAMVAPVAAWLGFTLGSPE